jgi:Endosomal/lysosomal potassium channel TMEM175
VADEESQARTGLPDGAHGGAFSDGVFAIAITLLVLEIGVPSGSEHDLLRALAVRQLPFREPRAARVPLSGSPQVSSTPKPVQDRAAALRPGH